MSAVAAPAQDRLAVAAIWVLAVGPLALLLGALGFEHWGGLPPCHLCLLQRGPLAAASVLGLFAAMIRPVPCTAPALRHVLTVTALVLAIGAGIAFYHAGVEWRWWPGPTTCVGSQHIPTTPEALAAARQSARVVRCDVVPWQMFGLSLAVYNFLLSTALAALALIGARRIGS